MIIHKLDSNKHNDFLKQKRIDPITGDLLQENDNIVLCAVCKSAFLADSWEYIERTHCNQNTTLQEIPKNKIFKLDKNNFSLGYFDIETLDQKMVLKAHEGVFSTLGVFADIFLILFNTNFLFMFLAYFIGLGIGKVKYSYFNSYSETLEIENRNLVIDRGLKTEKFFSFDAIEKVSYGKKSIYSHFLSLGLYKQARKTSDFKIKINENQKSKTYRFLIEDQKLRRFEREEQLLTKLNRIAKANKLPLLKTNNNQIENI